MSKLVEQSSVRRQITLIRGNDTDNRFSIKHGLVHECFSKDIVIAAFLKARSFACITADGITRNGNAVEGVKISWQL